MFDRDDQEISQIIEEGLEAVLSGEETLESFIAQHPEHAAAIRAELELAVMLVSYKEQVKPRAGYLPASRKRLLTRIQQEASERGAKRSLLGFNWSRRLVFQLSAALIVLIIFLSGTGGVVAMAQSALPGDSLYAIKRTSEQVAYTFTLDEVNRVAVSTAFAERRIIEAEALMEKEDYREVPSTIQTYEQQIGQAVTLLEKVNDNRREEKKVVAESLKKNLNDHVKALGKLQNGAPEEVRGSLQHAETTAMLGVISVEEETRELIGPTDTQQPTGTQTPTDIPNPTMTNTPPAPTDTPAVEETLEESTIEEPAGPPEKKITKTPRPTNENRPEKPTPNTKPEEKPPKPEKTKNKNN